MPPPVTWLDHFNLLLNPTASGELPGAEPGCRDSWLSGEASVCTQLSQVSLNIFSFPPFLHLPFLPFLLPLHHAPSLSLPEALISFPPEIILSRRIPPLSTSLFSCLVDQHSFPCGLRSRFKGSLLPRLMPKTRLLPGSPPCKTSGV